MSTRQKQTTCLGILILLIVGVVFLDPSVAFADFEGSLTAIQDKLINTFLPILAVIGLALAGISFASGNPSAKQHVIWAIIGCIVGFGAQGIVDLIQSLVS